MEANGNIIVPDPIFVLPVILTCECNSTLSSISTLEPIIQKGPIFAFFETLAFL